MKLADFTQGYVSRLRKVEEQALEKYQLVVKKAHHYNSRAGDWMRDSRNIAGLSQYVEPVRYKEMHDKYWIPGPPGFEWNGHWNNHVFSITIPVVLTQSVYTGKLDKQKYAGKNTARQSWEHVAIPHTQITPSEIEELKQLATDSEAAANEVVFAWDELKQLRTLIKNLEKLPAQYPKHEELLARHENDK